MESCPYYNPLVFQKPCLSVCHSADGRILVIGTTEGRFIVLDGKLGSHLSTIQVATGAVDSTKISPGTISLSSFFFRSKLLSTALCYHPSELSSFLQCFQNSSINDDISIEINIYSSLIQSIR